MGKGRARVWLSDPVLALPDDRFILRRPSPAATVGGGSVLDPFPPGRMNRTKLQVRLGPWVEAAWPERIRLLIDESAGGRSLGYLAKRTGLPPELVRSYVQQAPGLLVSGDRRVISQSVIDRGRQKLLEWLKHFHAERPNLPGAPLAQARRQIDGDLAGAVIEATPEVQVTGEVIALKAHAPKISAEQGRLLAQIEQAFRKAGMTPPTPAEVLQSAGADARQGRPYIEALIKAQRLVRVSDEIVFHADVIAHIQLSLRAQKGRRFSIPEFKEWTKVSRKYAVPLLEYLDRQRVTRREGDARVIL
jgi:selenocysteine-specific elongation factor